MVEDDCLYMRIKAPAALLLALLLAFSGLLPALAGQEKAQEGELADFFDDALFVGDSLMRQLQRHAVARKNNGAMALGKSSFATAQGYMMFTATLRNNSNDHVNLQYRGMETTLYALTNYLKPKRLIVLAGVNDGVPRDFSRLLVYAGRMVDLARSAHEDVQIAVISLNPMTHRQQEPLLQQANIDAYNLALEGLCQEKGVDYIDVASALKGPDGYLPLSLSSDKLLHLSEEGLEIMLQQIYAYAQEKIQEETP